MFVTCALLAAHAFTATASPEHELARSLAKEALAPFNEGGHFAVGLYGDGRPSTVIGTFDVGLDAETAWTPAGAKEGVTRFIAQHGGLYLGTGDAASLVVTSVTPADDLTFKVRLEQVTEQGLRLSRSDLVAIFWNDGRLHGLSGHVREKTSFESVSELAYSEVLKIVERDGETPRDDPNGENLELSPQEYVADVASGGFARWTMDGIRFLEREVDPETGGAAWRVYLSSGDYSVDEETASIVSLSPVARPTTTKTCQIRHADHPRDANGRVNSFVQCSSANSSCLAANGGSGGTLTTNKSCTADETSGTCHIRLQYNPSGSVNTIDRVLDDDGAEQEVTQACTSGTVATFTGNPNPTCDGCSNGDLMREQTAYWSLLAARTTANTRMWGNVAADQTDWVHPHHDMVNDDCWQGAGVGGCFSPIFRSIILSTDLGIRSDIWQHEFGHYIVWSYGDKNYNCSAGSEEGKAVHETWANVLGAIAAYDEDGVDPQYGALDSFGNGQGPPPHGSGAIRALGTLTCTGDFHQKGFAVEQAVWETLFNRNCDAAGGFATCADGAGYNTQGSAGSPAFPLWTGVSRSTQMTEVAAAAAYAVDVTPYWGTMMADTGYWFIDYVVNHNSSAVATRVAEVFQHHGM